MKLPRYRDMPWRTNCHHPSGKFNLDLSLESPPLQREQQDNNLFHYCLNEHVNGTGINNHRMRMGSIPKPSADGLVV